MSGVSSDIEAILARYIENDIRIKDIQAEQDTIKAFFKQEDGEVTLPLGRHEYGKFYVQVSKNTRFDSDKAMKELDEVVLDKVTKTVVDSTLAKRHLPPEQYEGLQKVYAPKIEIGMK